MWGSADVTQTAPKAVLVDGDWTLAGIPIGLRVLRGSVDDGMALLHCI